ncbi:MAG: hypothetical protein Q4A32_08615 [Lachnospiraceae bacterium]|nr:hypothetical protein [Lachnospiraceae bacterium]
MAAVSAAVLFTVGGCRKGAAVASLDNSASTESSMISEDEESVEELDGQNVRAAALSRCAAKMWLLAGGELIAAPEDAMDLDGIPKNIIQIGTGKDLSVDDLEDLDVDAVIADRSASGYADIRKTLSKIDVDVLEVGAESFENYAASMKLLTEYTHDEKVFEKYVDSVAARCDDIIGKAREASGKVKVTVTQQPGERRDAESGLDDSMDFYYSGRTPTFMVIRADKDSCRAVTNDDFICGMLRDFGMANSNMSGRQVAAWKNAEDGDLAQECVETESGGPGIDISGTISTADSLAVDSSESVAFDVFAEEKEERGDEEAGRRAFENVLSNNPDFIFIIYEGNEKAAAETCSELVKSCGNWKNSYAVKSGRVYELPQSTFRYPPYELWDLAYEYLYQLIYKL